MILVSVEFYRHMKMTAVKMNFSAKKTYYYRQHGEGQAGHIFEASLLLTLGSLHTVELSRRSLQYTGNPLP
jgi:hypothetical protein